ncbi:MAG: polysaccharide deacetylase family protein [Cyclobacteriaceae bacterium]|nr:polysaccharide deacetylase family protein [Cyclobacteriaceae bacterium]MDH4295065.1 polysaccharide deacetylase family protein [Cyclobacteriaceae bacterium]MDH5249796.1 polysaccharide deacetylase family protein [Cyclobacteriaceae bacterium]
MRKILLLLFMLLIISPARSQKIAKTEITTWQYGKNAAVSLTFDDGSINQFTVALPILNSLSLPATFFIITGQIPGSRYQGRFIGRPVEQIIAETAETPTNSENLFERASAIGFLGYEGTLQYHTLAGGLYDEEKESKSDEVYAILDDAYNQVRHGAFKRKTDGDNRSGVTWDQIRAYASQGHEFASHTVTHPRLAVLDEPNMLYELEKSKAEILEQLGPKHTFSAEGPYGTENERAMKYMYPIYPALRNRMPEPFLEELNRWHKMNPGASDKPYVQWQRGATTSTPLPLMKSWVDTVASNNNNWLVLVFHGVDGIGYEALPHELLDEYFQYIKQNEDDIWVATFGDATKYMRERMGSTVKVTENKNGITVMLNHNLDQRMYNLPLTLKSYVSPDWKNANIKQGTNSVHAVVKKDNLGSFVQYQAIPNLAPIEISNNQ